jgi:photosystem II stability/assembly factor-like uncharacterized protein
MVGGVTLIVLALVLTLSGCAQVTAGALRAPVLATPPSLTSSGAAVVNGRVLVTADGGATWRDATPSGIDASASVAASFLTSARGWVAASHSASAITIYKTVDAGTTWTSVRLRVPVPQYSPAAIQFLDPWHGWLLVNTGQTMNAQDSALYGTSDGGATWRRLSTLSVAGTFHFSDPSIGWLVGSNVTAAPYQLYATHDGGHTWQQHVIADGIIVQAGTSAVGLPVFTSARDGYLPIATNTTLDLLATHDGGATWARAAHFTTPDQGNPTPMFTFHGVNGWLLDGAQLYGTHDTGRTWTPIRYSVSQPSLTLGATGTLVLAGDTTGWAALRPFYTCQGAVCATSGVILQTTDGGQSWHVAWRQITGA